MTSRGMGMSLRKGEHVTFLTKMVGTKLKPGIMFPTYFFNSNSIFRLLLVMVNAGGAGVVDGNQSIVIRASQFFQIAMQIRGIVVGVKWVGCSQILLAQAYISSSPKHFCLM